MGHDRNEIDATAPIGGKLTAKQSGDEIVLTAGNFKDNSGTIDHYQYYLNGELLEDSGSKEYSYYLDGQAGKLNFEVKAVDAAGNVSKAVKAAVTVKDMTPPEQVTGLYVKGTATEKSAVLCWDVPYDNSGKIAFYTVYVDGKKVATSKTNTVTLKKLSAGFHTFSVEATDAGKNTGARSYECDFEIADSAAPTGGKLSAKQSGEEIVLTASNFKDNSGKIDHYQYYLNGKLLDDWGWDEYYYCLDGQAGKLNFEVKAVDAAGNVSKAVKAAVTVKDMTPPEQVTGLTGVTGSDGKSVTLTWDKAYDNSGSIASYEIWMDGKKKTTSKTNSVTVKGLSAGEHTFQVFAIDAGKNKGEFSDSFNIEIAGAVISKKSFILTGYDSKSKDKSQMYEELWDGKCNVDDWDARKSGTNALEVKSNHWVQIDSITFTDQAASLILQKGSSDADARTQLTVLSELNFGGSNDLLEIGARSSFIYENDSTALDFGGGNDTLRLCGGNKSKAGGYFSSYAPLVFGAGNDRLELQKHSDFYNNGIVDFGDGNDTLQIESETKFYSWVTIDFGNGNDTLILNGTMSVTDANQLVGLENIQGHGVLLLCGFEVEAGSFDQFVKAGITVVNCGDYTNYFKTAKEELADNTKAGAVNLNAAEKNTLWLCSKKNAEALEYGFTDAVDWLKFTVGKSGYQDGTLNFSDYGSDQISFELQDAKGNCIDSFCGDFELEMSNLADGVYYLKATPSGSGSGCCGGYLGYWNDID